MISTLPKNISKDISTSQCVSLFLFFLFYILLTTNKNLLQNTIHLISFLSVYHSQTLSYPFTSPLTSRLLFSMLIYISGIFHLSGTKKSSNSSVCKCFIFFFLFTWELNRSTILKTKNIYKNFFLQKFKEGRRKERENDFTVKAQRSWDFFLIVQTLSTLQKPYCHVTYFVSHHLLIYCKL